jgi:hypothetical protein
MHFKTSEQGVLGLGMCGNFSKLFFFQGVLRLGMCGKAFQSFFGFVTVCARGFFFLTLHSTAAKRGVSQWNQPAWWYNGCACVCVCVCEESVGVYMKTY